MVGGLTFTDMGREACNNKIGFPKITNAIPCTILNCDLQVVVISAHILQAASQAGSFSEVSVAGIHSFG